MVSTFCLPQQQLLGEQNGVGDPENESVLASFQLQLALNPYYFVRWFGVGPNDIRMLTSDQLQEFCHLLFKNTKRPRTKREIEVAAVSGDVVESEFSDRKTIVSFFIEGFVTTVLQRDGLEVDDTGRYWEQNVAEDGVSTPMKKKRYQIRSKRVAKWNRLAARANNGGLQFAEKLAQQGWAIKPQYMPAVTYLNKWGRLHIALLKRRVPKCDPSEYDGIKDFNSLPNESKGLVMAAKSFCFAALRTVWEHAKAENVQAMKESAKYDPKCFEWHYLLGKWLHTDRRTIDLKSRPSEEEIRIRWESYEVCDYVKCDAETGENSMLRNMALACVMQTLAEMVRFTCDQNKGIGKRTPQRFEAGDFIFSNIREVVCFIEQNLPRLQNDNYKPSFDEFVRIGDIFATILPRQHRNDAAALWFFEKAYEMKPLNSKLNHKLGLLHLTSKKFPDIKKATTLLETAYLIAKCNTSALLDLVKAMLRSPTQYKSQIAQYCEDALLSPILCVQKKEEIWFVLGCLSFCIGQVDDAVHCWITSESMHCDGPSLFETRTLNYWRRRYSWNDNILHPQDITEQLESYLENPSRRLSHSQRQAVRKIIRTVAYCGSIELDRAEGSDAVQRRCRRVFESQPQAPISDQDSDWRGAYNRVPLGEDTKPSNSAAYKTPHSRHVSTHQANNEYKLQPIHNKFYDQPTSGTDWTSKRFYNKKDNSANDTSSWSPPAPVPSKSEFVQ